MTQKLDFIIAQDGIEEPYTDQTLELFYLDNPVNIVKYRYIINPLNKAIEIDNFQKLNKIMIPFDMICQVETDYEGDKDNFRLNATYYYANGEVTHRDNLKPL